MELKPYQQQVIKDLELYLTFLAKYNQADVAFNEMYKNLYGNHCFDTGLSRYQKSLPNAAYVCIKVPTAGGKTFIACNALHTIFNLFAPSLPRAVVWLVPWSNLLNQTYNALSTPSHEYRKKLNSLFSHRVETYTKETLLQGANFNVSTIYEQLNIFVLNFASLRTKNKEDRKIFQNNGALANFAAIYPNKEHFLPEAEENSLINVIRFLRPVVIVDESHNAETQLSMDMLTNLNPSFVMELTATPQKTSNIISYTNAQKLKEENMVKLPVIVYNHKNKNEVISSALQLRQELQNMADQEFEKTGKYIRPIVLFQAQSKGKEDNITFQHLKQQLMELSIPEEEIKIKTATLNELDENLMSPDCKVKYIITINALKEGWDCPFAYILASLADKSSVIDVTQILGRILRQPYVVKHECDFLNNSYVITASDKFDMTLDSILKGLNEAGYSKRDYKSIDLAEDTVISNNLVKDVVNQTHVEFMEAQSVQQSDDDTNNITTDPAKDPNTIDTTAIGFNNSTSDNNEGARLMLVQAQKQKDEIASQTTSNQGDANQIPIEIMHNINQAQIRDNFKDVALNIEIPQFFLKIEGVTPNALVSDNEFFHKDELLKGFELSKCDTNINFSEIDSELRKIDLEETQKGTYIASLSKIENRVLKEQFVEYIVSRPKATQIQQLAGNMMKIIGDMYPIADQEIKKYVEHILEGFSKEQIIDFASRDFFYRDKIKSKIHKLSDEYAKIQFEKYLILDKIIMKPFFKFKSNIIPKTTSHSITKSLYDIEGSMNKFEEKIIFEIASLPSVLFWHRNIERTGFCLNGYKSNHYPDFIVQMKNGKTVILETKGDHLDGSDSKQKLELGNTWANKSGSNFKYFMVFENDKLEGAKTIQEILELLGEMK